MPAKGGRRRRVEGYDGPVRSDKNSQYFVDLPRRRSGSSPVVVVDL